MLLCLTGGLYGHTAFSQINVRDSASQAFIVGVGGAIQWPQGELSQVYGSNAEVSMDVWFKSKGHWLVGIGGGYLFGDRIRIADQILSDISTSRGQLLSLNGNYGDYKLFQRGFTLSGQLGKVFTGLGHNANSGWMITLGAGYMEHKIRFENAGQDLPQILDEYQKGYDRLRGGLMFRQFIGYMHSGNDRRVNFILGLDLLQAFTENYRGHQYDTGLSEEGSRLDLLYGFRFIWFLPIYSKGSETYYYQ